MLSENYQVSLAESIFLPPSQGGELPQTQSFYMTVLRHFRWKKELDLTLYMRTISLITSDICLKKIADVNIFLYLKG